MNRSQTLHIDNALVDNAVSHWRAGKLVAMPTETVYGLGADACNGEAVARIYSVKSRPQFNPLIVHVADAEMAKRYGQWNDSATALAEKFWPGPLTLVLRRLPSSPVSELVTAGGDTIALRVPAHPVALQLLRAFGGGIAAPSANRSGRISPTTADHVREELGSAIPLIIDGGACEVGLESTVVDLSGTTPSILRPGSITYAMLNQVRYVRDHAHSVDEIAPHSPGQLESHYAPRIPVRIHATEVTAREALLAFGATIPAGAAEMLNLSAKGNLFEAAANMFAYLRQLDRPEFSGIAVMPIPEEGIGAAINDRLRRAAVK